MDYAIPLISLAVSGYAAYAAFSAKNAKKPDDKPVEVLLGKFDPELPQEFVRDLERYVAADTKFWKAFMQFCSLQHIDAVSEMHTASDTRSIFLAQGRSHAWLRMFDHISIFVSRIEEVRRAEMEEKVSK